MALRALLDLAHRFKANAGLLGLLAAADLAGIVFGYYYYGQVGQFQMGDLVCSDGLAPCQPVWLWPLVADSPNAVLVFLIAVLAYRAWGWRSKTLDAAAFVLNVYVGLWTTILFIAYARQMGTYEWGSTNSILFVTHMGMPLQGLVLARDMRNDAWRPGAVAAVALAAAVFVAVDYWGPHLHPAPQLHAGSGDQLAGLAGDELLARASPLLMAAAVAAWMAICRPLRRPAAPATP